MESALLIKGGVGERYCWLAGVDRVLPIRAIQTVLKARHRHVIYNAISAAMHMDLCHRAIFPLHPLTLARRTVEHASTRDGSILISEDRLRDTEGGREEGS